MKASKLCNSVTKKKSYRYHGNIILRGYHTKPSLGFRISSNPEPDGGNRTAVIPSDHPEMKDMEEAVASRHKLPVGGLGVHLADLQMLYFITNHLSLHTPSICVYLQ